MMNKQVPKHFQTLNLYMIYATKQREREREREREGGGGAHSISIKNLCIG